MTLYPPVNMTNGFVGLAAYTNTITGDIFGWIMVFGIFIVSFMATSGGFKEDLSGAAVTSSFITMIIAVLLWSIGLVADLALLVFGIIFAVSLAFLMMKG